MGTKEKDLEFVKIEKEATYYVMMEKHQRTKLYDDD
jgi:hypothetical protein